MVKLTHFVPLAVYIQLRSVGHGDGVVDELFELYDKKVEGFHLI